MKNELKNELKRTEFNKYDIPSIAQITDAIFDQLDMIHNRFDKITESNNHAVEKILNRIDAVGCRLSEQMHKADGPIEYIVSSMAELLPNDRVELYVEPPELSKLEEIEILIETDRGGIASYPICNGGPTLFHHLDTNIIFGIVEEFLELCKYNKSELNILSNYELPIRELSNKACELINKDDGSHVIGILDIIEFIIINRSSNFKKQLAMVNNTILKF